ncbi:tungsten ABC transporter substrate-binding protein [Methanocalculus chunghsingensis]|uniref:Tungsten ABC transporter substrate-binding protein n=2 Tax=Methanocalculus chunghsingensis TaxID=156457 RepID=A0A8J7W4E5_9EURY|nr:tungsten ABC transporter substrate-binding protein [Methanocalculus chunghsingensis]
MRYILLLMVFIVLISGCTGVQDEKTTLRVFAAGSALGPLATIEAEYEEIYPMVDVQIHGHGSIQVIRQVTDLRRQADLVVVADESLIPDMMFQPMGEGLGNFTEEYYPFATGAIVIAYTERSAYADEITDENWHTILRRPDVRIGFSNPMLDACGYRALMVVKLAENYYHDEKIFDEMLGNHIHPPPRIITTSSGTTIHLPEMIQPDGDKVRIRDGSIFLLSLLETGGIDYAFEYRSVAEEHGLHWIDLPPEIDLSSEMYDEEYGVVTVHLGFQRFSSIGMDRTGQPIVYAAAIPSTAPNKEEAVRFLGFMVDAFSTGREAWPEPIQ